MRVYEVFPDGRQEALEPVAAYRADRARWGARTANANALCLLRLLTGHERVAAQTYDEALADIRAEVAAGQSLRSTLYVAASEDV